MIAKTLRSLVMIPALMTVALTTATVAGCAKKESGTAATASTDGPIARIAAPAGKAWSDVIAVTPEGGYRMGNPDAPIKFVEYGSLSCSHCAEFNKESEPELRDTFVNSGRVSFEFRNFVRDPIDITAAMLVRCAPADSFFALTHAVYDNQAAMFDKLKTAGDATYGQAAALPPAQRFGALAKLAGLDTFFAERGLPRQKAEQCLADSATADRLAKATESQSQKFDIDSTPTFLFNGEKGQPETWPDVKTHLMAMGAR